MATPTTLFQLTDLFNMDNFNSKITSTNTYINDMVTAAKEAGVKIATGSYVGTGTYGSDNPCSLTFDFEPQMVAIRKKYAIYAFPLTMDANTYYDCILWFYWVTQASIIGGDCYFSLSGNTLNYYTPSSSTAGGGQLNTSGETYCYIAIG